MKLSDIIYEMYQLLSLTYSPGSGPVPNPSKLKSPLEVVYKIKHV